MHSAYSPKPAVRFLPEWYKELDSYVLRDDKLSVSKIATIKKCIPVFDAITFGYIIQTPCDVYVSFKDGVPSYESAIPNILSEHPRKQAYTHPQVADFAFPKWVNPWSIETPKGYSTLFVSPMHNANPWFEIFEGVVDTDVFRAAVNFPFILKKTTGSFTIPAGTPIAQVIPFKRDSWESVELESNENKALNDTNLIHSVFFNGYKKLFWQKKNYK